MRLAHDMEGVSVLLPVSRSAGPSDLNRAVESIREQSLEPNEIVLVTNQPLSRGLVSELDRLTSTEPTRHEHFADATGLGGVLQAGLESCRCQFVARMDADDIADPNRLEAQLPVLRDSRVDVAGAQLAEFGSDPDRSERVRRVPTTHDEIAERMSWRCPVNHPTVMFDREIVLRVGGYRHVPMMEDWDLWARCLASGLRFQNLDRVLVRAQVRDLADRRGGMNYARAEVRMAHELRRLGLASPYDTFRHLTLRVPVRLLPAGIRAWVYRLSAR